MTPSTKEFILGIVAALISIAALFLWSRVMPFIIDGKFNSYTSFFGPIVTLLFAASLFSLAAIFIKDKRIIYPLAVAMVGVPYLFVLASEVILAALGLSIFFILLAVYRIKKEFIHSIGFSLTKTLRVGLPLYFTVVSLIISVFHFTQIDEEKAVSALLPRSSMNFILGRLSGPLSSSLGLPAINPDKTVDEGLIQLIRAGTDRGGIALSTLSEKELARALQTQRTELAEKYGLKLNGKEKVSDVFYNAIVERIRDLLGPYRSYLPFVSALTFFFAFKAITLPIYYMSLIITFGLIKFLVAVKIIKSEKQQIEMEKLSL